MANLLCHLHFWTFNTLAPSTVLQTGVHSYHHRTAGSKFDVGVCRKEWCEGRNISWSLTNHRPLRLRDQLKECEEMISSQRIVFVKWRTLRHLLLMLESGVLILYTICRQSGDIEGILIDRSLVTRIDATVDNALLLNNSILMLYATNNKATLVCINHGRRGTSAGAVPPTPLTLNHENNKRQVEKISFLDLKFYHGDIRGMPDQRIKRQIVANSQKDLVAVWWKDVQDDGLQWSSLADGESDNVVVIHIKSNGKFEVYAKIETKYNPVYLMFSKLHANLLYCVMTPGDFNYEIHSLECQKSPTHNTDAVITTNGHVTAFSMNKEESLLMLGCDNGTMIMYDTKRDHIRRSMAFFSPIVSLCWHPAGGLVFAVGLHGEVQCVDTSLNSLKFCICNEEDDQTPLVELGSYFMAPVLLEHSGWGSEPRQGDGHGGCYDNFVAVFNKGPIVLMRIELGVASKGKLGSLEILCEFLRYRQYSQARDLLLSTNQCGMEEAMTLLSTFMDHFLQMPLIQPHEEIIESVLTFYSSVDVTLKPDVDMYARRFFFKLLRNQRFEKAFRLAVDLSAKDLFMDLYHVAVQFNQSSLAEVCLRKAELIASDNMKSNIRSEKVDGNGDSSPDSATLRVKEQKSQVVNILSDDDENQTIVNVNFGYFS